LRFSFKAYRRPFRVPVRTSRGAWAVREGILLRLETDDGRSGFGEIAPIDGFGTETFLGALAWCASVDSQPAVERLVDVPCGMPCCTAAVHAALAGLEGGAPGEEGDAIPVAALLPTGPGAVEALERAASAGFSTFKVKIGAASLEAERNMVARLVDALPDGGRLRLDANGGLDLRSADRWLDLAADWPVEFIEQPLPVGSDADLVRLAADHATPVALDESVRDADDIRRWRDRGWTGVFVIKPALAGDPRDLVREAVIEPGRFVFSSALETDIGLVAGLRLVFAAGVTRALGYGVGAFFAADDLGGGLVRPSISTSDIAALDPKETWNRL
jgi:O-succinylbenzoate synthase